MRFPAFGTGLALLLALTSASFAPVALTSVAFADGIDAPAGKAPRRARIAAVETTGGTREQIPAESRLIPFSADIPACDAPFVLERIASRFADTEASYWNSTLQIARLEGVVTDSFRPRGLDLIPRRFCHATATLSNSDRRKVSYVIIESAGIIGATYDVHWCIEGYDRGWGYPPACALARP